MTMAASVRYIDKTQEYYFSEGYDNPYQWAHHNSAPFTKLKKPLSQCCLTIVSTSDVALKTENHSLETELKMVNNVYEINSNEKKENLTTHQVHYDRFATHLDDIDTFFPITRLHEALKNRRIGQIAPFFYGVYTSYSQKRVTEIDGPEVLKRCRENKVDAVIFTPV